MSVERAAPLTSADLGKVVYATRASHKTGDLSNPDDGSADNLAVISRDVGDAWEGHWIVGLGFFGVRFDKSTTRRCTDEERRRFCSGGFETTFAGPFRLYPEDFA